MDLSQITKEREDVWYAFSDLFLDTEPLPADLLFIAKTAAATSFSTEELISIMEDEVAPILYGNLMQVAGQWGAFHRENDVVIPIKKRLAVIPDVRHNGWPFFANLRRKYNMMLAKDDWQKVLVHMRAIRAGTESGA